MFTSFETHKWNEKKKIKPAYFCDLQQRPRAKFLFMTVDYRCLNFIRSHHGICLFLKKDNDVSIYDLSFCYKREIWVLYLSPDDYIKSRQIGCSIQLTGAARIKIMVFNHKLLGSD